MNFIHVREKKVAPKGLELPILGGAEIDRILIHLLPLKALCPHQVSGECKVDTLPCGFLPHARAFPKHTSYLLSRS